MHHNSAKHKGYGWTITVFLAWLASIGLTAGILAYYATISSALMINLIAAFAIALIPILVLTAYPTYSKTWKYGLGGASIALSLTIAAFLFYQLNPFMNASPWLVPNALTLLQTLPILIISLVLASVLISSMYLLTPSQKEL